MNSRLTIQNLRIRAVVYSLALAGFAILLVGSLQVSGDVSRQAPDDPPANTPATGEPTIIGTAQVGETLTADTSQIADADGTADPAFTYQWTANDGGDDADIAGATGAAYTLVDDDEGKTVKVRVSFTDDAGHAESLTSEPTAVVTPKPNSPATGLPTINGTP